MGFHLAYIITKLLLHRLNKCEVPAIVKHGHSNDAFGNWGHSNAGGGVCVCVWTQRIHWDMGGPETGHKLFPGPCISQFSSVQSLSRVRLFGTPWITARQASLSITNSWSSLKLKSIESSYLSSNGSPWRCFGSLRVSNWTLCLISLAKIWAFSFFSVLWPLIPLVKDLGNY